MEYHRIEFRDVAHDFHETIEKGHGRIDIRRYRAIAEPERLERLKYLVMVQAGQRTGDKTADKARSTIASLTDSAERALYAVRRHRSIENELLRMLNIAFREDESRISKNNSPLNSIALRYIMLNLLKQETTAKCDTNAKRLQDAWNKAYLSKVLAGLAAQDAIAPACDVDVIDFATQCGKIEVSRK
jgi:predicted transposase YbfD/YdcC